jgi:hypothetical protein
MKIEELWRELESGARTANYAGWVTRLALPEPSCRFSVGIEAETAKRGLLFRLPRNLIPARSDWPSCRGLDLSVHHTPGENSDEATLFVVLKESRSADVFTTLVEDLLRRVASVASPAEQVKAMLGQLVRWQKFLAISPDGLSEEHQRGLWGELHFLREQLLPTFGQSVVKSWKGSEGADQDFQFSAGAVEVKTTVSALPQTVRISNERQLDDSNWPALFLHVLGLEIRDDVDMRDHSQNQESADSKRVSRAAIATLPAMVASIRDAVLDETAHEYFDEQLLSAGYVDTHAHRYAARRYLVRSTHFFRVGPEFPRLIEAELPPGVGDVDYALSVAACEPFKADTGEVLAVLRVGPTPRE